MHIVQIYHGALTRLINVLKHLMNATILLVLKKGLIFTLLTLVRHNSDNNNNIIIQIKVF